MKNNTPLISVIITVYNMEAYLQECVNSVLQQSYTHLEILLIDDGSTDTSPQLCDRFGEQDSRIRVLHKANGGLVSAWMSGVELSAGEYLCFLDSDDWIDRDMIRDLSAHLTGSPREIVCSNYIIEKKDRSIPVIQSMPPGIYEGEALEKQLFPLLLGKERRSIHCSRCMKLFSRTLIVQNQRFCDKAATFGEDMSIVLPALLDADRVVIVENGLYYHYRFVDSSMVHKYNPRLYDQVRLLCRVLQQMLDAKKDTLPRSVNWEENLKKETIFLFLHVIKNELRCPDSRYLTRIPQICGEAKEGVGEVSVRAESVASRLLYYIFRHPNRISVSAGRLLIGMFDRLL